MAVQTLSSLWRFVVQGHVTTTGGSTRKIFNIFHYESSGGTQDTPGNRGIFATHFNTSVWSTIAAMLHVDYVPDGIYTWKMTDPTDSLTFAATQSGGALTGGRLPTNQSVFGYNGGGLRGPSFHGSKRYAPIAISQTAQDELIPAAHTAWEAAHAKLANVIVFTIVAHVIVLQPMIYSRTLSAPNPPPANQIGCDLTTTYVDLSLSSWRHRREATKL